MLKHDFIVNIEITAISDHDRQFIWQNNQDKLQNLYKKINPTDQDFNKLKKRFNSKFLDKIKNETKSFRLIIENQLPPERKLKDEVLNAIEKKSKKNHIDKENTILVIDNRTSYVTKEDILNLEIEISNEVFKFPFCEVWLYTGCFSDDNGANACFAFCQLK